MKFSSLTITETARISSLTKSTQDSIQRRCLQRWLRELLSFRASSLALQNSLVATCSKRWAKSGTLSNARQPASTWMTYTLSKSLQTLWQRSRAFACRLMESSGDCFLSKISVMDSLCSSIRCIILWQMALQTCYWWHSWPTIHQKKTIPIFSWDSVLFKKFSSSFAFHSTYSGSLSSFSSWSKSREMA